MAMHRDLSEADLLAQALKTAEYDHTYQESVRSVERVVEEERARELRVQLLLLEDENDTLQAELEQCDTSMERLENSNADLGDELADTKAQLAQVQTDLKVRVRELEHARAEVTALNNASADAANILADKLALTRELATLKPELEYLKSQRNTQQNLLAEKLSLEREMSAMQVELDNEKRTVERLKSQGKASSEEESARAAEVDELKKDLAQARKAADKQNTEISDLKAELEKLKQDAKRTDRSESGLDELRKELARTKKEAQKAEKDHMKQASQWESQKELLESKLDAFRTKLRSTKEQLRTAQDELETAQADKMAQSAELTKARMVRKTAAPPAAGANRGRRTVARFDPDATIGTPGQGPAKRQRTSFSVGDKSTVSMTPFFNKTALSILPETTSVEEEAEEEEEEEEEEGEDEDDFDSVDKAMNDSINQIIEEAEKTEKQTRPAAIQKQPASKKATTARKRGPHPLRESTTKANTVVRRQRAMQKKLSSEADDSDDGSTLDEPENAATAEETEMTKKQPRLLAEEIETTKKQPRLPAKKRPNIFDDDDNAPPAPLHAPAAPKIKSLKSGSGALANTSLLAFGRPKSKTLAQFSPLKKDRRGAGVAA